MAGHIELGIIHHIRLTVTDIDRSRAFYTGLLGFDVAVAAPQSDGPKSQAGYPGLWGGGGVSKGKHPVRVRPPGAKGAPLAADPGGLGDLDLGGGSRAR